jgi:hypothetical protein
MRFARDKWRYNQSSRSHYELSGEKKPSKKLLGAAHRQGKLFSAKYVRQKEPENGMQILKTIRGGGTGSPDSSNFMRLVTW